MAEGDAKLFRRRNYQYVKELNVALLALCSASLYGQWEFIMRNSDDLPKTTEAIATALQVIISMIKMLYYLFMQRRFHRLLYQALDHELLLQSEVLHRDFAIKQQLNLETTCIMDSIWKNVRRQLLFFLISVCLIASNYFVMACYLNINNAVKKTPNIRPVLPFPALWPFWEDKGLAFPYFYIQMFIGACGDYCAAVCSVSFDGLFIILCMHAVGLIRTFKVMVENLTSSELPKSQRLEYLRCCIYQYQRVYGYVNEVDAIFKQVILSQFILGLITMAIVLYQMSIGLESDIFIFLRMLIYLAAAGYEIVLYCYNGQSLTNASDELSLTFYCCEWYNESKEFKYLLGMMIMRTNRIFYLSVSWFSNMTLPTLMSMVRTSGSYFLLLRKFSE